VKCAIDLHSSCSIEYTSMKCLLILSLFLFPSCNTRASLTPEKALLGHWVQDDSDTHCYFSQSRVVGLVSGTIFNDAGYVVTGINEDARSITIELIVPSAPASLSKTFTFSSNKSSMVEKTNLFTPGLSLPVQRWNYVDAKQKP
jgi:hypothetical protein